MNKSSENGIAIILSMFVLSAILAIAMGISTLLLREVQIAKTAGFSIPAFFAADTGVEKLLMFRNTPGVFSECISAASPCTLANGANFWILVRAPGEDGCTALNFCIESTGEFRGTRRAVEVNY